MKLKKEVIISSESNGGTYYAMCARKSHGIDRLINLNETASFIGRCMYEEFDEESIAVKLMDEYEVDKAEAINNIRRVIEVFRESDFFE